MNTLIKMSWRNLYRNSRRTLLMALVIAIGFVGMIFTLSFAQDYLKQSINNAIEAQTGHIQIHQQGFHKNPVIKRRMNDPEQVEKVLAAQGDAIKSYTHRIKNQGMINSSESSAGVMMVGIDPAKEAEMTKIKTSLVEGEYLNKADDKMVYISRKLAKKLKVERGDKVVVMGQTINLEIGAAALRIKGIFETDSPGFDKGMVFMTLPAAQKLFEMGPAVSEFSIIASDGNQLIPLQQAIKADLGTKIYEIMTWQELMPMMATMMQTSSSVIYIIVVIILIAVSFSIVNTLFVIVFERFREFGIMKALGTPPRHIFMLIIFEALGMTVVGLGMGGIVSFGVMSYFRVYGLNLSAYASGMAMLSVGDTLYLTVAPTMVLTCLALSFLIVGMAATYPALVAARIEPIKALKFV